MKEYLKMSDYFSGAIGFDADGDVFDNEVFFGTIDIEKCDAFEHAINSHDELVEMNKELLAALEGVIDYLTFDGFRGRFNSIGEGVDLTDGLKKFMDVIAKAKGERQSQQNVLRDDVYVAGGKE